MVFPPKYNGIFGPTHPQYGYGLGRFFSNTGRAIRGIDIGNFWGKTPKAKPKTPANLRQKAFFNKIGNVLNPVLKEVEGVVSDVGTELVGKVLQDVITGKDAKTSLKARGKEAGVKAVNTSIKRIEKGIKRKRDPSESKSDVKSKKRNIQTEKNLKNNQIQTKRNQIKKVVIKHPKSKKKRKTPRKKHKTPRKKSKRRKKRNKGEPKDIFTST